MPHVFLRGLLRSAAHGLPPPARDQRRQGCAGRENSIAINQDADLYVAKLASGDKVTHELRPQRHAWIHVAEGDITMNGQRLQSGDAAALSDESGLSLTANDDSQVLLFDLD